MTTELPPLPAADRIMWQYGQQIDHYSPAQMRAYAAEAVRLALEAVRGGHDLDAMCEAFNRVIEAHASKHSPFHQPINADAAMALRVLRGVVAQIPKDRT